MELHRLLLAHGYNSAARPVPIHNLALEVNFVLALTQVIDMVQLLYLANYVDILEGTVRPDWICMRVLPLDRP
jgi:hypothetical protein